MTSNVESVIQLGLSSSKHTRSDKEQSKQSLPTINENDEEVVVKSLKKQRKIASSSTLSADMSTIVTPALNFPISQDVDDDNSLLVLTKTEEKSRGVKRLITNKTLQESSGSDNDLASDSDNDAESENSANNSSDLPVKSPSSLKSKRQKLRASAGGTVSADHENQDFSSIKKRPAVKQLRTVAVKTPEMLAGLSEEDINNFFEMLAELQRDEVVYDRRVLMQNYESIIVSLFQSLKQISNKHRFDWIEYDDSTLRSQLLEMVTQRKVQDFDNIATVWLTNLKASLDSTHFGDMQPLIEFQSQMQEKMYECGFYTKTLPSKYNFNSDDQEEKFTKLLISAINRTSFGYQKPTLQLMSNDVRTNHKPKTVRNFFHVITHLYAKEMAIFRESKHRNITPIVQGGNPNLSDNAEESLPPPSNTNQNNNAKCNGCGKSGHLLPSCPHEKHMYFNRHAKNNVAWLDSKYGKHFKKLTWPNSQRHIISLPSDLDLQAQRMQQSTPAKPAGSIIANDVAQYLS